MRKIIAFSLISLDGYFADTNGGIDWHVVDEEFNQYAMEQLDTYDTLLFGRVTYTLFEQYWPSAVKDPKTSVEDITIGKGINAARKIVFSKTLQETPWENSEILTDITKEQITKLKEQPGKDIVIFGSGTIVQALTNLNLIDEYRMMINPIILGEGKPMFKGVHKLNLTFLNSRTFKSGNMLLSYSSDLT